MPTEIFLDGKGEERYFIAIYIKERLVNGKSKPEFRIRVYDIQESVTDEDWIATTTENTEEKARKAMDKFYKEYYPEGE